MAAVTVADGEIARAIDPAVRQYHAPMLGVWDLLFALENQSRHRRFPSRRGADLHGARDAHRASARTTDVPVHLARLGGYYNLKGYRHAHAWVGNTRGIRDYLTSHGLPADRVHYIGNFVDSPPRVQAAALDALRIRFGLEGCRVMLGLGRLHPNKGWADLLDAFARLPASSGGRPCIY